MHISISIYPVFYLLKGDHRLRVCMGLGFWATTILVETTILMQSNESSNATVRRVQVPK